MKVLVTGGHGMLAHAVVAECRHRGFLVEAPGRAELDVTDAAAVFRAVARARPHVVIQCAAWTRVDDAEANEADAFVLNATATDAVARAAADVGARFVFPSTDYVFPGSATAPIPPDAAVAPLNAYGRSKLAGEEAALRHADALVVRTSWLYGPHGRNFVSTILQRARSGAPLRVVDDQRGSPTTTRDLAWMILGLLEANAPAGIYHATNAGETTWYGLACAALETAGIAAAIEHCTSAAFPTPAARPAYSVLDSSRTWAITGRAPHWSAALERSLADGL